MRRTDVPPDAPECKARRPSPSFNRTDFAARAKNNVPDQIEYPHPLSWWRTRPARSFKNVEVFIARRILQKAAILGEPHWFLGAAGDAAVALGVAMRIRRERRMTLVSLDLAMTAVLCVALEGDAAAALFLSATLKSRSDAAPLGGSLSDSWLADESKRRWTPKSRQIGSDIGVREA